MYYASRWNGFFRFFAQHLYIFYAHSSFLSCSLGGKAFWTLPFDRLFFLTDDAKSLTELAISDFLIGFSLCPFLFFLLRFIAGILILAVAITSCCFLELPELSFIPMDARCPIFHRFDPRRHHGYLGIFWVPFQSLFPRCISIVGTAPFPFSPPISKKCLSFTVSPTWVNVCPPSFSCYVVTPRILHLFFLSPFPPPSPGEQDIERWAASALIKLTYLLAISGIQPHFFSPGEGLWTTIPRSSFSCFPFLFFWYT